MSNITIFCFTTFCVNLPINPSYKVAQLTLELRYLEKSLKIIDQKLELFEDKLKFMHVQDFNDIVFSTRNGSVFAHTGPALQAVRDAVEAAENEGRNSSHCFTIAINSIKDEVTQRYNFDLVSCQANFSGGLQEILQKVKPLRESITPIQQYFKITVPNCYNSIPSAESLNTTVSSIRNARKTLKMFVNPLLLTEQTTYPRLKDNFAECISAIATKIEEAASLAQREGIRCAETTETTIHQST